MSYQKILNQYPSEAGKPFYPSNGTEGMIFISAFCENCIFEKFSHTHKSGDSKCEILTNSILYSQGEKGYPREWRYDDEGWPHCSEYKHWDWGDSDDLNDPGPDDLPPPPPDPNQLNLFPLYPDERNYDDRQKNNVQVLRRPSHIS